MIAGIGIDMVDVRRMTKWMHKPALMERYFNPSEIADIKAKGEGASAGLAARFAAKEAYGKALGSGLAGITLKDITVKSGLNGEPRLLLTGTALAAFERKGASFIHLSLSHEKDNAIAIVVLEYENRN
ncbi:MAG: holo-ACP synthase [Treponema sp.]|nr:holo-ACP synthase [Treponema sp.]